MLLGLFTSPTGLFLGVLLVAWAIFFWFQRPKLGFSMWATAGLIAYVVSYFFANSWRLGENIEEMIVFWEIALGLTGFMYAAILLLVSPSNKGIASVVMLVASVLLVTVLGIPHETVVWQKSLELGQLLLIFAVCLICFSLTSLLFDRCVWGVLMIAELFAVIEYLDCQLLHKADAPRIEGSACGQVYGEWVVHLPPIITTAVLLFFLWRWFKVHGQRV